MKASVYMSNRYVSIIIGDSLKKINSIYRTVLPEGCMINGVITNSERIIQFLKEYFTMKDISLDDVSLVIDSTQIITKVLDLPLLKEKELLNVIKKELNELTDVNSLVYDYLILRQDKKQVKYLVCGIDDSIIENYIELFNGLDIQISRMNIALASVIKMIAQINLMKEKTGVVIVIDGDSIVSVLYENGDYIFSSHTRLYSQHGSNAFAGDISRNIAGLQQFLASEKSEYKISEVYLAGFLKEDFDICKVSIDIPSIELYDLDNKYYNLPSSISYEDEVTDNLNPKFGDFIFPLGNY